MDIFNGPIAYFIYFHSIVIFSCDYLIPCLLFLILYGKILVTLKRRKRDENNLGQSAIINCATNQLTKSALIVTIVFVLTVGPDNLLYLLSSYDATDYSTISILQKHTLFFSLLNSCANPVIYLCVLPSYRHGIFNLFHRTTRESNLSTPLNTRRTTPV